MSSNLHFKPAYELAAMIRRRELKPSELMAATIERIEADQSKDQRIRGVAQRPGDGGSARAG